MKTNWFLRSILRAPEETEDTLGSGSPTDDENESEGGDPEEESEDETEESEEEESTEETPDPEVVKQALGLFNALNDPLRAPGILAYLNAQLPKGEKITQKDAQINIKEILNTELGEEYSWLTDKLSVGLDKIINGLVEAKLAPLQAENQQIREDNARSAISSALDPIIEEIGAVEFDRIAPKLTETMQKYPRPAAQTVKSYMKDMMKLVSDKVAPNTEKIKKNIREAKRPSSGTNENRVKTGSKLPTYREGIEAAMRGERFE